MKRQAVLLLTLFILVPVLSVFWGCRSSPGQKYDGQSYTPLGGDTLIENTNPTEHKEGSRDANLDKSPPEEGAGKESAGESRAGEGSSGEGRSGEDGAEPREK
jgi:hypothetical protein